MLRRLLSPCAARPAASALVTLSVASHPQIVGVGARPCADTSNRRPSRGHTSVRRPTSVRGSKAFLSTVPDTTHSWWTTVNVSVTSRRDSWRRQARAIRSRPLGAPVAGRCGPKFSSPLGQDRGLRGRTVSPAVRRHPTVLQRGCAPQPGRSRGPRSSALWLARGEALAADVSPSRRGVDSAGLDCLLMDTSAQPGVEL